MKNAIVAVARKLATMLPAAGSAYVVTVAWQQPGEAPHSLVPSFNLAGF